MEERRVTLVKTGREAALLAFFWFLNLSHPTTYGTVVMPVATVLLIVFTVKQWRYEAPLRVKYPFAPGGPCTQSWTSSDGSYTVQRPVTWIGPCNLENVVLVDLHGVTLHVKAHEVLSGYVAAAKGN